MTSLLESPHYIHVQINLERDNVMIILLSFEFIQKTEKKFMITSPTYLQFLIALLYSVPIIFSDE